MQLPRWGETVDGVVLTWVLVQTPPRRWSMDHGWLGYHDIPDSATGVGMGRTSTARCGSLHQPVDKTMGPDYNQIQGVPRLVGMGTNCLWVYSWMEKWGGLKVFEYLRGWKSWISLYNCDALSCLCVVQCQLNVMHESRYCTTLFYNKKINSRYEIFLLKSYGFNSLFGGLHNLTR